MSKNKKPEGPSVAKNMYRRRRACSTPGCWRLAQPYNDKCLRCLAKEREAPAAQGEA